MRKAILLSILGVILLASKSEAQRFITSFGTTQSWGMPYEVVYTIQHDYWGYDIVHTTQIVQHGKMFFDVVLQRGDVFISINIGARGSIFRRTITYEYPFYSHVCSAHCGFHDAYYRLHRSFCNSHHHHGHNHVVYNRPAWHQTYVYGQYNQGFNHGYKKGRKDQRYDYGRDNHRETNSSNSRINSRDYQRRSGDRVADSRGASQYNSRSGSSGSNSSSRVKQATTSSTSGRVVVNRSGRSSSSTSGRGRAN